MKEKIESLYQDIHDNLFRTRPENPLSSSEIQDKLSELTDLILKYEGEDEWYIGEGMEACLSDMYVGCYWALADCYSGQTSQEYSTLCKMGEIFSPGMTGLDKENSGEFGAYEQFCEILLK